MFIKLLFKKRNPNISEIQRDIEKGPKNVQVFEKYGNFRLRSPWYIFFVEGTTIRGSVNVPADSYQILYDTFTNCGRLKIST